MGNLKKILLCLVACMTVFFNGTLVYQTCGYLSDYNRPDFNRFTFGNVDIQVDEEFTPVYDLDVGTKTYPKRVKFTNKGRVNAYARVFLAKSNGDVNVKISNGSAFYTFEDFKDHLSSDWSYQDSGILGGYYYYTKPLKPGESTSLFITDVQVTFTEKTADTNMTVNQTPRDFDIYVYAEGLQQQKLDGSSKHTSWTTAWTEFLSRKE